MNNFIYTIDPTSPNPIMLINDTIGNDGINGADFQRELLMLDTMNKESIEIMINSPGGSVFDGFNIASAIINAKTKIITNNVGIAGSIAGVIFMSSKNRIMSDYALLMMHNTSGGNEKARTELNNSISLLLSKNSSLSQDQVKSLMQQESWMNFNDCMTNGFCNELNSNDILKSNSVVFKETNNHLDIYEYANQIIKQVNMKNQESINEDTQKEIEISNENTDIEGDIDMSEENKTNPWKICSASVGRKDKAKFEACVMKVKKEYGIHNDIDEDTFENNIKDKEESMKNETEEVNTVSDKVDADYMNLLTEKDTLIEQLQNEIVLLKMAEKEKEITNFISNSIELGKITDENKDKWINMCKSDFESAKDLINSLAINKEAPKIENNINNKKSNPTSLTDFLKFNNK